MTDAPIHRKEFTKLLPVELTEEEFHEAAKEMADAHITIRRTKEKRKGSNAVYNGQIEDAQKRADEQAQLIEDGYRTEEIKCEQIFDYKAKSTTIIRLDFAPEYEERTVETRDMSEEELQMQFPDQSAGDEDDPNFDKDMEEDETEDEQAEAETVEA